MEAERSCPAYNLRKSSKKVSNGGGESDNTELGVNTTPQKSKNTKPPTTPKTQRTPKNISTIGRAVLDAGGQDIRGFFPNPKSCSSSSVKNVHTPIHTLSELRGNVSLRTPVSSANTLLFSPVPSPRSLKVKGAISNTNLGLLSPSSLISASTENSNSFTSACEAFENPEICKRGSANTTIEFEQTLSWSGNKVHPVVSTQQSTDKLVVKAITQRIGNSCVNRELFTTVNATTMGDSVNSLEQTNLITSVQTPSNNTSKKDGEAQSNINPSPKESAAQNSESTAKQNMDVTRPKQKSDISPAPEIDISKPISNETVVQMFEHLLTKVDAVKQDLSNEIQALKNEKDVNTEKINSLESKQTATEIKVSTVQKENVVMKDQVDHLMDAFVYQQQILDELNGKVETLQKSSMNKNLIIKGLIATKTGSERENCVKTVRDFFQKVMEISEEISIKRAFRIGRGKVRTMLVILKSPADKAKIFDNVGNLKEKTNTNGKSYKIENQLPNRLAELRNKQRNVMWRNKKTVADRLEMQLEKGILKVDGQQYQGGIITPQHQDLLRLKSDEIMELNNIDIGRGAEIQHESSKFQAFIYDAVTYEDVNRGYEYVRYHNMDARHIVCACLLPGANKAMHADFVDDAEHGSGAQLLQYMMDTELEARAIYVCIRYDGKYIGAKRFECMIDAAKSAVNYKPYNRHSDRFQFSWGRNPGRGGSMAGGRPMRHVDEISSQPSVDSDQEIDFKSTENVVGSLSTSQWGDCHASDQTRGNAANTSAERVH